MCQPKSRGHNRGGPRKTVDAASLNQIEISGQNQPLLHITESYDGDGQPRSRVQVSHKQLCVDGNCEPIEDTQTSYYVRSSVLGGAVIADVGTGEVKKVTIGDTSGSSFNGIVDLGLAGGKYVVLLKDVGNVSVKVGASIKSGQEIGAVTGGLRDAFEMLKGLHFAIIRSEYYDEYRRLTPHTISPKDPKYSEAVETIARNQEKWFVDPLSDESPFKCPGITTRIDIPIRNGQPTVYPLR